MNKEKEEMDDLISRQAAINAIENTECEMTPAEWDELTDAIMNVPSAEPRKWKWTPCTEKYPDMDETVLVYTNSHEYYVWDCMSNREDDYFWEDEKGYYHNKYEVDSWMSLPEV